jgi:hypothetical protein
MLIGATAAIAASSNDYSGTAFTFSKGAGTKANPVGVSFSEVLKAKNVDSTKVASVLTNIKVKIYGIVSNTKNFPTCDGAKMVAQKSDTFCPAKSKFATGLVNSFLGNPTLDASKATPCNPNLDVFNAGGNKLWFFFTTHSATQCNGLTTGATAPYPGFVSAQGKYMVLNVPLPKDISTQVANVPNLYGSLVKQTLQFAKVSTKVKGKTVFNNASVGCLNGKRPWSVTYTDTPDGGTTFETSTVTGSAKC